MMGLGRALTVTVSGRGPALGAVRDVSAVCLRQLWCHRRAVAGRKCREQLLPEPVPQGAGTEGVSQQSPHIALHLKQEVSWSRVTSRRHSGSVTFLALSEKRSNSDGEIR